MSKELIERLRWISGHPETPKLFAEAADLIEAQQKRIEELEFSWAGCSQQLKDACQDLDETEGVAARATTRAMKLEMQLAASQAHNKVLREALNAMLTHMGMDEDEWNKPTFDQARNALAQPTDDSALREMMAKERERLSGQIGSIGRFCKSEDDCIDQGIDFAAYEIGLIDSIEAVRKLLEKSNG